MDDARTRVAKRLAWLFHKSQAVNVDTSADEWWECIGSPQQNRWLALADEIVKLLGAGDALLAGICFCSDKPVDYDGCKDHKMQGIYCIEHGECPPCRDYAAWLAARAEWGDK